MDSSPKVPLAFTSDNSSHVSSVTNLFLCDVDASNLNDSYRSVHLLTAGTQVYAFTFDYDKKIWGYVLVGVVNKTFKVQSPCSFECVLSKVEITQVSNPSLNFFENNS
jgi:hypothetical protein